MHYATAAATQKIVLADRETCLRQNDTLLDCIIPYAVELMQSQSIISINNLNIFQCVVKQFAIKHQLYCRRQFNRQFSTVHPDQIIRITKQISYPLSFSIITDFVYSTSSTDLKCLIRLRTVVMAHLSYWHAYG